MTVEEIDECLERAGRELDSAIAHARQVVRIRDEAIERLAAILLPEDQGGIA
jgi:hypothetical protein